MKTIIAILYKSLIIIAFMQIVQIDKLLSQKSGWIRKSNLNWGIQINQVLNGSGHGMLTDLNLTLKKGKSEFALGAFTQCKFEKISGGSFQYKFMLSSNKKANLYAHYSVMYHKQNSLNNCLNKLSHPQDYDNNSEFEKYNTLSNQIGIGLETMTLKNLFFDVRIGIGGYTSHVVGEDNRNKNIVGREDNGFSFMAALGLKYRFSTKFKKQKFGKF